MFEIATMGRDGRMHVDKFLEFATAVYDTMVRTENPLE